MDAAPPPPPAIVAPAPREVSFGRIEGRVSPGTTEVRVRVDGRLVATKAVTRPRFVLVVTLPRRDVTIRVSAIDARGRRASTLVGPVFGLPRGSAPYSGPIPRSAATRTQRCARTRPLARPPLSRGLRRLRPGPPHRSRRRLERACPLPGGVDAEARDRRRADAGAPRCRRPRLAARRAPLADARLLGRPLGQRAARGDRRLDAPAAPRA